MLGTPVQMRMQHCTTDMISPENWKYWREDCMRWRGEVLANTPKAHWCEDWDGLPMNEECEEFKAGTCSCYAE